METKLAGVTITAVEVEVVFRVAVIVALPELTACRSPELLMVALADDELQVTDAVKSWVVLSLNVPIAVSWWDVPAASERLCGVTTTPTSEAGVILIAADPCTWPSVALTVAFPCPLAVAFPELSTDTTAEFEELHVIELERSCVLPSVNAPVAVNF